MVDFRPEERHGFYVEFEARPEEDRNASIEQGYPVFVDVDYAIITMPGGSLVVEKVVTDDLLRTWKHGKDRTPPSPFAVRAYEAWKDGKEAPLEGIDLKNWPGATPSQIKMCANVNIRTVEDLAAANGDAIRKMGMGAVALVQKAKSYLENAVSNKASEQVSALMVKMEAMQEMIDKQSRIIAELSNDDGDAAPKRKYTKRKELEAAE